EGAPGDEARRRVALDPAARKGHPEVARAPGHAHPQHLAGTALAVAHVDVGFRPEEVADVRAEEMHRRHVARRPHALGAAHRRDANALALDDAREKLVLLR